MATWFLVTQARARVGVYPGSFNPPTIAHIEIAVTAREHHDLDRVDFAVSTVTLGKEAVRRPSFAERIEIIEASVEPIDGLGFIVTDHQLIADIASGYDVVVMGADKWAQVNDVEWYTDTAARDAAIAALPTLALAARTGFEVPEAHALPVDPTLLEVSSSAVRAGRTEWMTTAARAYHDRHGPWGGR